MIPEDIRGAQGPKPLTNVKEKLLTQELLPDRTHLGSTAAGIEEEPHMVAIIKIRNGYQVSSGSIISEQWILTDAFTLQYDSQADNYLVRSGSNYQYKGGNIHNVSKIIIHEDFKMDGSFSVNDIALMKIVNSFQNK